MKLISLFFCIVAMISVHADEEMVLVQEEELDVECIDHIDCSEKSKCQDFFIEAKAGYFFFYSGTMGSVYDEGGLDLQLSLVSPTWKHLQIYGSVEGIWKEGKSSFDHEITRFNALPLSLGLRAVFDIWDNFIDYYLTVGPRYFFVWIKNNSSFVPRHMNANGLGGFANTGLLFHINHQFCIDLFGECSFKKMQFHSSKANTAAGKVQVGGYTFGGGLGYSF